jgi:hypothetical protein
VSPVVNDDHTNDAHGIVREDDTDECLVNDQQNKTTSNSLMEENL